LMTWRHLAAVLTGTLAALCLAAFVGACRCYLGKLTEVRVKVAEGEQYCEVVTLPDKWLEAELPVSAIIAGLQYRWPPGSRNEFLITPLPADEEDLSKDQKITGRKAKFRVYRISLRIPVRVRQADDTEWSMGQPIQVWPREDMTTHLLQGPKVGVSDSRVDLPPGKKDPRTFRFEGFSFPRSGDIWDLYRPVLFPETKRYVALQSFNGWYRLGGLTSPEGDLFLDIYRVADRQPLARMTGTWCDFVPEGIFRESVWLSDNDLIMPFGYSLRSFLLCHLP
jgi:hypothetical protein